MLLLIASGALFACIVAIFQGRRRTRVSKPLAVRLVSLRPHDPGRADVTTGLRDPFRSV